MTLSLIKFVFILIKFSTFVESIEEHCSDSKHKETVQEAFRKSGIIKDLNLEVPASGMGRVDVMYGMQSVSCGTNLKTLQTVASPKVSYKAESGKLYTLMMVDPDAPSRDLPLDRSALHWMVVNIEGDDVGRQRNNINNCPYLSPGPPPGTGRHRYVQLVFEQSGNSTIDNCQTSLESGTRMQFNVRNYISSKNLSGPVFGNFFYQSNP